MKQDFAPCVYILASRRNGTVYTGATSNLIARVYQHRTGATPGFTSDHGIKMLVWFEMQATMEEAFIREKRIKNWNRAWRLQLIKKENPNWRDLAIDLGFEPLCGPGSPLSRG
jgi:putative endonuclease